MAGSALHKKSAWAAGRAVLTPLQEEFNQPGGKGPALHPEKRRASTSARALAHPVLRTCRLPRDTRCKPLHQNAVACSRSALFLERACCSQQHSSTFEFQQPGSFTSLCKSLLSLEFDKIHTLCTACTDTYKSSIYWLDTLIKYHIIYSNLIIRKSELQ